LISGGTGKTTPVDADTLALSDSAASNATKKVSLTNLWTNLFKGKADALYQPASANLTEFAAVDPTTAGLALLDDADASAQRTTLGLGTMAVETASNYAKKSADADVDMNNYKISEIKTATFNSEHDAGNTGTSLALAFATAQKQKVTLNGNATLTATFPGVGHYQLKIVQDATPRAITWSTGMPSASTWLGAAAAPTHNTASGGVTIVNLYYDGTNTYGSMSKVGV
jgi:hypothetical protein